ncbi:hypothetical protein [Streptosporangium sp. NBC_01469]|uniref:hypothetical protein n=1 Tax=Streptosporangium sp. NBC_01469 TaxID=2903898 RepID=UPI002E282784|nr:hypothetical protein [Streptosporangium sp. NBC_01469]
MIRTLNLMRVISLAILVVMVGVTVWWTYDHWRGPWSRYSDSVDARRVLVNAFSIANPGYYIDFFGLDPDDFDIDGTGGTIDMLISPRVPDLRFTPQWYRSATTIHLGADPSANWVPLNETLTTQALDDIFKLDAVRTERQRRYTSRLLGALNSPMHATAVVSLKAPASEEYLDSDWKFFDSRVSAVVFSAGGAAEKKPITWSGDICGTPGFSCSRGRASHVEEFQRWASSLEEEDAQALSAFGLDLRDIRRHALSGLIQGFVITASSEDLRKLQDDSRVQWLSVTDVILEY